MGVLAQVAMPVISIVDTVRDDWSVVGRIGICVATSVTLVVKGVGLGFGKDGFVFCAKALIDKTAMKKEKDRSLRTNKRLIDFPLLKITKVQNRPYVAVRI